MLRQDEQGNAIWEVPSNMKELVEMAPASFHGYCDRCKCEGRGLIPVDEFYVPQLSLSIYVHGFGSEAARVFTDAEMATDDRCVEKWLEVVHEYEFLQRNSHIRDGNGSIAVHGYEMAIKAREPGADMRQLVDKVWGDRLGLPHWIGGK